MGSYRSQRRVTTQKPKRVRQEPLPCEPRHELAADLQFTLPLPEFIDDLRHHLVGRLTQAVVGVVEQFLIAAAETVAGPKHQGVEQAGDIYWHGQQRGSLRLQDTKLAVKRPRLRSKSQQREVAIPYYQEWQNSEALSRHLSRVILNGISMRRYEEVLPGMMEAVGVSRSSVSRAVKERSQQILEELMQRRFEDLSLLAIFLDGVILGPFHMIVAIGVARDGTKHVLGLREGGSENKTVIAELLKDLVQRGIQPEHKRLFIIDGSKALRSGITAIFGEQPVQRCRLHKERNVLEQLPQASQEEVREQMRSAWQQPAEQGIAQLERLATTLEKSAPSAAGSLREGLEEMFTINRLGLPESLQRSFSSTNVIDSTFNGTRRYTRQVSRWQDAQMALRWAAASLVEREAHFCRVSGYKQLWRLQNALLALDSTATKKSSRS
jgi:putative transposase